MYNCTTLSTLYHSFFTDTAPVLRVYSPRLSTLYHSFFIDTAPVSLSDLPRVYSPRLSTLYHSFFTDTAPVSLSDLLRVYSPSSQLRSSSDSGTPRVKTFLLEFPASLN